MTVLVLGLLPREDRSYSEINMEVNSRLQALGESSYIRGIDFLDCSAELSDSGGDFQEGLYERDGVSLNQAGMAALAACLKEVCACIPLHTDPSEHILDRCRRCFANCVFLSGEFRADSCFLWLQNLLDVENLKRVTGLGRSFYKEAKQGTVFNPVDRRIGVLPELPDDIGGCEDWSELALSDGNADSKNRDDGEWMSDHETYARTVSAFGNQVRAATKIRRSFVYRISCVFLHERGPGHY